MVEDVNDFGAGWGFQTLEQVTCDGIMKWSNLDQTRMDDKSIYKC